MSYLVLARKWRPKSFDTLVGQEHVVRALTHALQEGRLHHAYLFTGTRGIGKTTIARILAKSLNCESGVSAQPCGQCSACVEIDSGRFVDLLEVDAATNTRVDEMRLLLENAVYAPTRGRYKVYVIDEVHMLSNAAFNAMLKTLEEPPEHVKFILATTDPQKIPVTVLSRCLQFNLKQMPQRAIVDHLTMVLASESVAADLGALRLIAHAADGSMRDALSLLDQAIAHGAGQVLEGEVRSMLGTVGDDFVFQIVDALLSGDAGQLVEAARLMSARSLSFESALSAFCDLMVRVQTVQLAPSAILEDEAERGRLEQFAEHIHPEYVQLAYDISLQGREQLAFAPDKLSGFLMVLFRLHAFCRRTIEPGLEKKSPRAADPLGLATPPRSEMGERSRNDFISNSQSALSISAHSSGSLLKAAVPVTSSDTGLVDWASMVNEMRLSGLVRELAQNCELTEISSEHVVLCLGPGHRHLLAGPGQDRLQQALERLTGVGRPLVINVGAVQAETPAAVESRVKLEAQCSALEAIEGDAVVREFVQLLDATVSQGSIEQIKPGLGR